MLIFNSPSTPEENIVIVGIDIAGGNTRSESVINGLNYLEGNYEKVLILEAARPLVTMEQLDLLISFRFPSITFVAPCVDTIILKNNIYLEREMCLRLQTPQAFDFKMLKEAYLSGSGWDLTDETRLMYQKYNIFPHLLEGGENLFKVTYPKDLIVLEQLYNF